MIKVDETLLRYTAKYFETFGTRIALRMLPASLTNQELYDAIDSCIGRDTDDLMEQYAQDGDLWI